MDLQKCALLHCNARQHKRISSERNYGVATTDSLLLALFFPTLGIYK